MIAREAILNDPEVVELLRAHFVCIAIDNVDFPQLTAAEREFVQDKGLKACTQGMSVFTAGGRVLATGGGFEAKPVKQMLRTALSKYQPEEAPAIPPRAPKDEAGLWKPPADGLVLFVTWKALADGPPVSSPTSGNGTYDTTFQRALGVDRLWVRKDEADALARGEFPASLQRRLRPHLSYVMAGTVQELDLTLRDGRLAGSFRTDTGARGELFGYVEARGGRVVRFDLIARGPGERVNDFGFSASLTVAPTDRRVPVAILFKLADPQDDLARVPPHRAKNRDYLR